MCLSKFTAILMSNGRRLMTSSSVVVAAGLIALVDDSIKARFHSKHSKQIMIPKLQMGVEYIGPKRLINEMFNRDPSRSRSTSSHP